MNNQRRQMKMSIQLDTNKLIDLFDIDNVL